MFLFERNYIKIRTIEYNSEEANELNYLHILHFFSEIVVNNVNLDKTIVNLEKILNKYTSNSLLLTLYISFDYKNYNAHLYIDKNPNQFSTRDINNMICMVYGYLVLDGHCADDSTLIRFSDGNYRENEKIIPHSKINKWFPYLRYIESKEDYIGLDNHLDVYTLYLCGDKIKNEECHFAILDDKKDHIGIIVYDNVIWNGANSNAFIETSLPELNADVIVEDTPQMYYSDSPPVIMN